MPSSPAISEDLKEFAEELAKEAQDTVKSVIAEASITIKSDGSPVTSVDLAVESALRQRIEESYPAHGILGEEFGTQNLEADWVWVIDPIDGTRQFAAGLPNYSILIALCYQYQPVIGIICQPFLSDIYLGVAGQGTWLNGRQVQTRPFAKIEQSIVCYSDPDAFTGQSRKAFRALRPKSRWNVYDGGSLSFGTLAAGHIGVSLCAPNLDCFDICALVPVVEGAGGVISDWQGKALGLSSSGAIVASACPELHQEVLAVIQTALSAPPAS
ncbi:MAG: inositol monophosphatase family protein [Pseudomonadota bacterium]